MSSALQVLGLLMKHGQYMMVYPNAFIPPEEKNDIEHPEDFGLPGPGDLELVTSDGIRLRCYLIGQQDEDALATVITCHGNAMCHGDLLYGAREFFNRKCNVLTLSYRGYGTSEGTPTEKGLRIDAQTALDYVMGNTKLRSVPVILHGLSLGGAVAIDLAYRNSSKISGLIIENTFLSLPAVVKDWPYIGVFSFVCHQKWDSAKKIVRLPPTLPILMLSGAQDEVVPQKHMKSLWELAQKRTSTVPGVSQGRSSSFKGMSRRRSSKIMGEVSPEVVGPHKDNFKSFPEGFHANTLVQEGYWDAVGKFLKDIL